MAANDGYLKAPNAIRVTIAKHVIVDRLQAAGKLAPARARLEAGNLYARERFGARTAFDANDAELIALLNAIGADPSVILAPE
jgi:hypothetical protein